MSKLGKVSDYHHVPRQHLCHGISPRGCVRHCLAVFKADSVQARPHKPRIAPDTRNDVTHETVARCRILCSLGCARAAAGRHAVQFRQLDEAETEVCLRACSQASNISRGT